MSLLTYCLIYSLNDIWLKVYGIGKTPYLLFLSHAFFFFYFTCFSRFSPFHFQSLDFLFFFFFFFFFIISFSFFSSSSSSSFRGKKGAELEYLLGCGLKCSDTEQTRMIEVRTALKLNTLIFLFTACKFFFVEITIPS